MNFIIIVVVIKKIASGERFVSVYIWVLTWEEGFCARTFGGDIRSNKAILTNNIDKILFRGWNFQKSGTAARHARHEKIQWQTIFRLS